MKLLTQDRTGITTIINEVWLTKYTRNDEYAILHDSEEMIKCVLGIYPTEQRAKEILLDILRAINEGKATYIMPES